jgi:hypothetical protein
MSDTEHRKLRESLTELRPNAIWFLLTLFGSALAAWIISWISNPAAKTIVVGIGLCINALLIAWLSWLRTRDNKANTSELTVLLERIERLQKWIVKLQSTSVDTGRQRQQLEQPTQPVLGLENSHPHVAEPVTRMEPRRESRAGFADLATSGRWGIGEQDTHKQWARLNAAEKAMVRFVLVRGTATAASLLQFRDPEGSRPTDACAGVKEKTSFLLGDLENGLTINSQLKPYLEKIIVQDKGRAAGF